MRIAFKTFGCKANSVDTDVLFQEALRRGHEIVAEEGTADAYVINSCTVTAHADRDARVQANRYKRRNPNSLVAVIGCYGQVGRDELLQIPEVDFVVGTANKLSVLDHLVSKTTERDQVEATMGFLPTEFLGSRYSRATIKIQDGCNFKCSFCIIPEARGRSRSLLPTQVKHQVEQAYAMGFQEVILTGIHLAHYGWDLNTNLDQLLDALFEEQVGPRIRISTLDPFEVTQSLIERLKTEPRLCPHLHIALQSGSDRVLSGMRRIYKAQEFVDATNAVKAARPDAFIGVDVIVGFPGETDQEFEETVAILGTTPWTKLHVFPFSARTGTKAAGLPDPVPASKIFQRAKVLREMSESRYDAFLNAELGNTREVILERPLKSDPDVWQGHTENYLPTLTRVDSAIAKQAVVRRLESVSGNRVWTN